MMFPLRMLKKRSAKAARRIRPKHGRLSGPQALEPRLALAADGLDASFGAAGKVTTDFGGNATIAAEVQQPDGKILAVGQIHHGAFSTKGSDVEFALARYNSDGSLDRTFGTGGKVVTPLTTINAAGASVALQPDGKIVVVGAGGNFEVDIGAIARYNADGSLDTSFGQAGTVVDNDAVYVSTALEPDGDILAGGSVLRRFHPDGSLDTSFGVNGTVQADVTQLALLPDGKILVASRNDLRRLNADGSLDTSFGTAGIEASPFAPGSVLLALEADGDILWGGAVSSSGPAAFQLNQFKPDGTLDRVLATIQPSADDADSFYSITVLSDGRIALGGVSNVQQTIGPSSVVVEPEQKFAVVVLNGDGSRDASFGTDGEARTSFGVTAPATAFAVLADGNGQIVLAGGAGVGDNEQFALARFSTNFRESFVAHLYLDLLGRAADTAGLTYFTTALANGQMSRAQVAATFIGEGEYRVHEVTGAYSQLLRRAPDVGGLAYWSGVLASGGTINQVKAGLLASDEYFHLIGGGTHSGYLAALYHDALGRDIDAGAAQWWSQLLALGQPRAAVVSAVLTSSEYVHDEVNGLYVSLLNRTPDGAGLTYFQQALTAGYSPELATAVIAASDEYYSGV